MDTLNHPEWQADSRDATIHNGYIYWRTKKVTVDDSGSAIVFDFNATDAMYYIVEKHDEESLPETVEDKAGNEYVYEKTYFETEYVRRDDDNGTHDEFSNKTLHPQAMHITEEFTRDSSGDNAYASIPEVAGKFTKLDGIQKKEGFLEFYVYNIYKPLRADITLKKVDKENLNEADPDLLKGASFTISKYTDESYQRKDTTWGTSGSITLSDEEKPDGTYTRNGEFVFRDLSAGYYQMEETDFPDGYIKLTANPRFKVEANDNHRLEITLINNPDDLLRLEGNKLTIVVGNTPGAELPNSGGPGTIWIYLIGSILLLGCGTLLAARRRIGE